MKNLLNSLDLEAVYNYDIEEASARQRSAKKSPKTQMARTDKKRSAEAKAKAMSARYSDEQILAKKAANKEIAEKKALQNKAAIAAKKREENGSSYRFKSPKSRSDRRR